MSRKRVYHHPDNILRITSKEVPVSDITSPEMQRLVADMKETMVKENGVGLAAPQVGEHIRMIVCETPKGIRAFFNPTITFGSKKMVDSEEGCLSIPEVYGIVKRHKSVKAQAYDENGQIVNLKTGGLLAVILQHEIDHLNGILFIDRAHTLHDMTKEKAESIL